jgi:hypothetical protein
MPPEKADFVHSRLVEASSRHRSKTEDKGNDHVFHIFAERLSDGSRVIELC